MRADRPKTVDPVSISTPQGSLTQALHADRQRPYGYRLPARSVISTTSETPCPTCHWYTDRFKFELDPRSSSRQRHRPQAGRGNSRLGLDREVTLTTVRRAEWFPSNARRCELGHSAAVSVHAEQKMAIRARVDRLKPDIQIACYRSAAEFPWRTLAC